MFHSRLFLERDHYRSLNFQATTDVLPQSPAQATGAPYLDGNHAFDRPLFVQFCANEPEDLFHAAQIVAPYCDAVDLNLGCPQGIARKGKYGAFLQEDWERIYNLIRRCHEGLDVPITAKMRILATKEKTLDYARMILSAGANVLTVHGRTREQKGRVQGVADWDMIRFLRDNLPPETVMFANGNIRCYDDIQKCIDYTGVDAVMSAEGNLRNPAVFYPAPSEAHTLEGSRQGYFRSTKRSGWRLDFMLRRYLDLIHRFILQQPIQSRSTPDFSPALPLWINDSLNIWTPPSVDTESQKARRLDGNLHPMRSHIFSLLEDMIKLPQNHPVRDKLAHSRTNHVEDFEEVLAMVESNTESAIREYEGSGGEGSVWWVCGEDLTNEQ
jgi:tRNA-dihydrouridine synthase 1